MAWLNGAQRRGNDVMETHDFLLREEVTDVKYIIFVGDERLVNLDYETTNIYEISFRIFFVVSYGFLYDAIWIFYETGTI